MVRDPKEVLHKSSKKLVLEAVEYADQSDEFLMRLIDLALHGEEPYGKRCAWAVQHFTDRHPDKLKGHLRRIADRLPELENHTQIAGLIRIFDRVDFDMEEYGDVLDFCIHLLRFPFKHEYIKVFALNIIGKFGNQYPELIPELKGQIIEASTNFNMGHVKRTMKKVLDGFADR